MTEEISALRNELDKTRNIVRIQRVRYQQLVSLFSAKLREKEEEARVELQAKHVQLTRILRSLYVLESRLRKEQRVLKTTLNERDALITTQENEITNLKTELEKIVLRCGCPRAKEAAHKKSEGDGKPAPMKPDLISSIGIEILRQDDEGSRESRPFQAPCDEKTFLISSLDDYDVSRTTLRVKEPVDEGQNYSSGNEENVDNENRRSRAIDERLQNEMRKFKMKDAERDSGTFKIDSPRKILKEVTENPNEKLNGPVLKCIKQILSQDGGQTRKPDRRATKGTFKDANGNTISRCKGYHPVKPPKPVLKPTPMVSSETNVSSAYSHSNMLMVKPLPKITEDATGVMEPKDHQEIVNLANQHLCINGDVDVSNESATTDESKIVQTVSALLSDSTESEEDNSVETAPTVSQMVKKFEGLKSNKMAGCKQLNASKKMF